MTTQTPRRPRRCGSCTMFGHDRRGCHLIFMQRYAYHQQHPDTNFQMALTNYRRHSRINENWIRDGGAGHTVPQPQQPKTQFELACENDCKITHTDECCICMESLGEKNKMIAACGHQFHFGCFLVSILT